MIEFARGNLTHTLTSKRKLRELVEGGARRGLGRPADARRSRACGGGGYTPAAIRRFLGRGGRGQA